MKNILNLSVMVGLSLIFTSNSYGSDTYQGDNIKFHARKTPEVKVKVEKDLDKGHFLEIHKVESPRDIASEEETSRDPSSRDTKRSNKGLKYWEHSKQDKVWDKMEYWQFNKKPI